MIVTLITTILVLLLFQFQGMESAEEISYNKFIKMVEDGDVEKVDIGANQIDITAKQGKDDTVQKNTTRVSSTMTSLWTACWMREWR